MNWKAVGIGFVFGALVSGGVVWAMMSKPSPERYLLTKDLDLQSTFFFTPQSSAPVKGVIKAGSEFEVDWRYSDADYVVLRTVVDRKELMSMSKPAPPETTKHPEVSSKK